MEPLTVSSEAGTETGDTKITIDEEKLDATHVYKYKVATAATEVTYDMDVTNWNNWDGEADITAETGKIITIVEADATRKAKAAGSATVISAGAE